MIILKRFRRKIEKFSILGEPFVVRYGDKASIDPPLGFNKNAFARVI